MVAKGELPQSDCVKGNASTVGFGFTVMVMLFILVLQPFAIAVIVNVVVCELLVVFVKTPLIEVELPEEGIPVILVVLVLVQLKVVPEIVFEFVITIGVIAFSEQTV